MKSRQGNVFTSVCQELCPWGEGVSLPACTTGHMTRGVSVRGVSVRVSIQGGLYRRGSVRGVSVRETPPHHSNEWAVRILLECILVRRLLVNRGVGWGGMGFSISCIHCQQQRRRFNHVVLADEHQMKLISTSLKV